MPESISVSEFPEVNWPLVVGIGILAAVLVYALYIVNQQLTPISSLTGGISSFINSIENGIASLFGGGSNPSDQ